MNREINGQVLRKGKNYVAIVKDVFSFHLLLPSSALQALCIKWPSYKVLKNLILL